MKRLVVLSAAEVAVAVFVGIYQERLGKVKM
jgi:hypothetical protein